MGPRVDLPDPLAREGGVELVRGDTRMSEQLLDDPQIRAALEEMGREGMAERVRRDIAGEPRPTGGGADHRERLLSGEPTTPIAEEQRTAPDRLDVVKSQERRPCFFEPPDQPIQGDLAHRDESFAV